MFRKDIDPKTANKILISAVELLVNSGAMRDRDTLRAIEAAGVLIINGETGEEHRSEPRPSEETDDNKGRPRRPLIEESPELQLEVVPTDDPDEDERRFYELQEQGAIMGW